MLASEAIEFLERAVTHAPPNPEWQSTCGSDSKSIARAPSRGAVFTPVFAQGSGPGAGRIDFPFGMTPEVFLLK